MITPGQLKRIALDGLPEAIMLKRGAILFRHYEISVHAIDRFVERCDLRPDDILPMLHEAALAFAQSIAHVGIRRVVSNAEQRGGYVLVNGNCYFIVVPDQKHGRHVVTTVLTPRYIGQHPKTTRAA